MERSRALTLAAIVVTLLLASAVGLQSILLIRIDRASGVSKKALGDVLQDYIDNQVDAGVGDDPATRDGLLLQKRKILISYDINARTARQVVERLFYLDALDSKAPIDLYVSTQGGWTDSAFSIVDAMRLISAPVNTWAIGGCYSAGAVILSAGTGTRRAMSDAVIMVHVNLESSEDPYTFGRIDTERYESFWKRNADLPGDWYPMSGDKSYYLTPEEAARFGVIDEVVPAPKRRG